MNSPMADNYAVFEKEVKAYFQFLENDYGFRLIQIKRDGFSKIIRYESSKVFVNLLYGPPDYEVSMSFGRIGFEDKPGGYSFGQGDLVLLNECKGWEWNADYPNQITAFVAEFARLLQHCGSACLKGDNLIFLEMKKNREAAIKNWRQKEEANNIRQEIDLAWRQKDFGIVVLLYEGIKEPLTEVEKKRLNYAKKYCRNSNN